MKDPSLAHLFGRLGVIEERVAHAVERRRAVDPNPDDPFRGLYLSADGAAELLRPNLELVEPAVGAERLAAVEHAADASGVPVRLRTMAQAFGLEPLDLDLLLVALAPDLDARFERLYGYLQDDVTRRRASVGLALELVGVRAAVAAGRDRFSARSPLVGGGLVLVEEHERPFLTRPLRVPDRVTRHLLGGTDLDPVLVSLLAIPRACRVGDPAQLARVMAAGPRLCYLRERPDGAGRALAAASFALLGKRTLALDFERLGSTEDAEALALAAFREARLQDAGLVAGPVDRLFELGVPAVRLFAENDWMTVLTGSRTWDPAWSRSVPLVLEVPSPAGSERGQMWADSLNGDADLGNDVGRLTVQFRLGPEQIARAADSARIQSVLAGRPLDATALQQGARAQNTVGLERLARRIEPAVGWESLVLPFDTMDQLHELTARVRHRSRVLDEWEMRSGSARGRGITALFAGESGTGKTLAAEVLARELGLDLYTIDLATVVDKYIGETEKNLDRIFAEADYVNGVLFFDEADALFGKRSDVQDAHDRYANVEVAYLLQRMETFDGIAILATNLRANLDDAFARRLDAIIEFPVPDEAQRRLLWDLCLGARLPRAEDIDLDFCARAFELSGGNIRNVAIAAAYRAAEEDRAVAMADLIHGTRREYGKLGRLLVESEFGPYHAR
jgi:Winged helix domain, variant/ATPase family associated with various cellular activities (AAA)